MSATTPAVAGEAAAAAGATAPRTVAEMLARQARLHPELPALIAVDGEVLTYAALHAEVRRVAGELAALGFGRGSRIAVALPNGPAAAVALLAAMSAGACAPLDPLVDGARAGQLLGELRVDALIAGEAGGLPLAAARESGVAVLGLAAARGMSGWSLRSDGVGPRAARAPGAPVAEDVALLLLTSGTTGVPRIVPTTQAALLAVVRRQVLGPGDRFLLLTPLSTRNGVGLGLLSPLATGAASIVVPGFDAARFVDWLDSLRPTCYTASATVHSAVLDALRERTPRAPLSLRFVRASSAPLPAALQRRIEAALGVPLIQGYGMTETGTIAQNPLPPGQRREGSAGIAFGTQLAIADVDGTLQPAGAVGEILVRGPGLMQGYENDPEATRSAFRDGWFRTGDLGCLDSDGYLFITGRAKELVNRGGVKIAPAEVDAALLAHPEVKEAATFGVAHPTLGEDVVSAVVLRESARSDALALREFALRSLPPAKAPSQILVVDALPRNALGKLVRHALAERLRPLLAPEHVPPRNASERLVAAAFAEVLGVARVGALDNFFLLGGDSLRAAQAIARLAELHRVALSAPAVFEAPTVAELAARIDGAAGERAPAPPIVARVRRPASARSATPEE